MTAPVGEILTGIGLLMNIVGVYYLTLIDLFTSKPLRMWWFYHRHVDRENPQDTDREPPVGRISPIGGGFAGGALPSTPESYDGSKQMVRNQSIATIGLIGGFIFQFLGLLV